MVLSKNESKFNSYDTIEIENLTELILWMWERLPAAI